MKYHKIKYCLKSLFHTEYEFIGKDSIRMGTRVHKIIIWGMGYGYSQYINFLKYQELLEEIEVVGVTDKLALYDSLDGYQYIPSSRIKEYAYDYIVVTSDKNLCSIIEDGVNLGLARASFIPARVFSICNFRFSKYVRLKQNPVSLIANNCWGGIVYHVLGLEFCSPFINMFENDIHYLKLLSDLKYYLNKELEFVKLGLNQALKREYPICKLGDVELHFNHYSNMKDVETKWYKRIEKINWDNIFVMMYTLDPRVAFEFDKLEYDKKICFVPFKSSLNSAYYLKMSGRDELKDIPFWEIVNKTASGHYHDYALLELLLTGKVSETRFLDIEERKGI